MGERGPAGEAGRGEYAAAAVGDGERLSDARAVGGEVLERERAALVAHVLGERRADVAAVERPRAVAPDGFQSGSELLLVEMLLGGRGPGPERRPLPVLEEERRGVAVAREVARVRGDKQAGEPVDKAALT